MDISRCFLVLLLACYLVNRLIDGCSFAGSGGSLVLIEFFIAMGVPCGLVKLFLSSVVMSIDLQLKITVVVE